MKKNDFYTINTIFLQILHPTFWVLSISKLSELQKYYLEVRF